MAAKHESKSLRAKRSTRFRIRVGRVDKYYINGASVGDIDTAASVQMASGPTRLMQIRIQACTMAADGETSEYPPEDEMLPDERAVIVDRLDELNDEDSHLSVDDVADDLGIDIQ